MSTEEKKAHDLVIKAEDTASALVNTASDVADTLIQNSADREKTLLMLLTQHFHEDKENFTEIRKNQKKYEELIKIDGEHMSFIRRDVTVLKTMLEDQNEDSKIHRESMERHMKRVEPMVVKYERNKIAAEENTARGSTFIKWFLGISGVIGAYWIIKDFIIKLLLMK